MRTYSVWNYRERRYDYYQAPGPGDGTHAGTPPTALLSSPLGQTPDEAAWHLPPGATKIGSGLVAKGKIASLGDDSMTSTALAAALALGVAYYLWKG